MANHDYVIANQSGAAFRTDLNNALAAIVSNNSSSSEPATKYAYQWWADTSTGILKLRNSGNSAWIDMLNLDGTNDFKTTGATVATFQRTGSTSNVAMEFKNNTSSMFIGLTASATGFAVDDDNALGTAPMFFVQKSDGNVGIGQASPASLLTLNHATNPAIQFQDSGTKVMSINAEGSFANIASFEGKALQFATNSGSGFSSAMVIDTDQDVGIGVTSPSVRCDIADTDTTAWSTSNLSTALRVQNLGATNSIAAGIQLRMENGAGAAAIQYIHCVGSSTNHSSDLVFTRRRATTGAYEEQMRIKNHGELSLKQASSVATTPAMHLDRPSAASNAAVDMIHFDSGNQGRGKLVSASSDAGSPALASRSDYRIKENIRDYTNGWDIIKAVPVKLFDVKTDGSKDQKGWIAHELQAVLPDLVQGTKDAVDEDGNPIYQSVSMGLFMPDVISALQAAITKIETLETKVAALEAA